HAVHRVLPSFPTRRSSDLIPVWEVESGRQVSQFSTGKDVWDHSAVFLPDSRHVLTAYKHDARLFLWEAATGKQVRALKGHDEEQDRKSTRLNSSHVSISYA